MLRTGMNGGEQYVEVHCTYGVEFDFSRHPPERDLVRACRWEPRGFTLSLIISHPPIPDTEAS